MAFVESIVNAPMEACKSMLKSISTKLGYSSDKQYINDTSLEKVLKEKTEFRVTKVTVKKWEVIDQIKIHFDDDTEWSYGPDCGDEDPRALIMTEGEYLTRATHEKLYDHESAGASVEFETNKGRVFKFAPSEIDSISLGHDSNKKTVIADEGYEIVCLKIHRGELIGSEQQPVPKDDLNKTHPKSWYVLAYYAEKEDADLDNELLLEGVAPTRPFQRTRNKPNEKEDKKDESNDKVDDNDENKRQFSESGATLGRRKSLRKRLTSEALNINDAVAVLQRASSRDDTLDEQIPLSPLYQRSTSSFHRSISREAKTPTEERKRPNLCRGVSLIEDKEFFPSDAFTSIPEKQEEPALETTKKEADNENKSRPDEEPTKDVVETTTDDNATDVSDDESDSDSDQEILDLDLDYYHFHDQRQTQNAWKKIKDICSKKRGRGAILVDCLRSSVTKKTGNNKSIDHCRDMATQRGYCSSEDEDNYELFEVFYTLYESMAQKAEFLMFISTIFFMSLNLAVGAHKSLLEGQILTAIATDPKSINWRKMNTLEEMFCGIFFTCDGSYLSLCRSLMLYYFTVRMSLSFFNIMNSFLMKYLSDTKTAQMGRDLFVHALFLDKRFFDETKNIHSYMNVQSLHDLLFDTIPNIITSVARYFVVCYYLISMDLNLGLASVFFTTFFNYFIVSYFIKRDIERWKKQVQIDRVHGQISYDVFEMISTVKTFAKERYHQREYDEWFESLIQSMKKGMSWEYFRSFLEDFIDACEYIGMIYYGYIRYTGDSGMTSSDFIGFIILYQQLHGLFCEVRDNLMWVGRGFHDVKRCTTLRETQPKMINGTNKPENIKGEIVFKDVKFKYPSRPKDQVLKGLNLTIKSNCMTAIVGKSGAGKSTIAKLVTRLYDPSSGSITVDGEDLKSFDVEYFRSNLAVVDQSPELFNRPLAENIAYGMVDSDQCTYAELEAAGKLANCDFISKFREGYYTFAGYGGNDLSGGQLQRIAIARAAIRNPKILILDEATSSLDSENEKEVQEALEKLMKGRTVIVIAHRLSTIRNADNIVCMKDGTVVEQGNHDDLMEKRGAYHKLISQQILEDKKKKGDEGGEQKSVDGEEQKSDVEGGNRNVKNGEKIVEKSVGNKVDSEDNVKNVDGEANNVVGIDDSEEKEKAIESAVESAVESAANSVDEKEIADKDTMEVENLGEIVETKQPVTTWGPYIVNENNENNEEKAPGSTTTKGENDSSVETTSENKEETAEKTGDNSLL